MTTPSKASARMTPTAAPEPTPAVERVIGVLIEHRDIVCVTGSPEVVARDILEHALNVEEMTEVLARFRWEHRAVVLRSDRAWDESDWGDDGPHARNLRIRKNAYLDGARKDVTMLCTHLLGTAS